LLYMYSDGSIITMLVIRLDPDTESRLERLAKKTGRTKTFYAREAILEHLEDLEDIYLATQRLRRPAKTYSAEDVKRELGL
jgi:RHH-type rel operon transcriptional repressor/antitoxin RelB